MEEITSNVFFGIVLTLVAFELGLFIFKKAKIPILNPILIAMSIVIFVLLIFDIPLENYNQGGSIINSFLGPATVVLAIPLYRQRKFFISNAIPILVGILVGSSIGIISIIVISKLFGFSDEVTASLIPKSVTTPIGIELSEQMGGISSITILAITLTGIIGAVFAPIVLKICKIDNPVAKGVAIGTSSHALGTTKAIELGEVEGAMSSLAIGIAGLMTVIIAPLLKMLFLS